MRICQSCAMPLYNQAIMGHDKNGKTNLDYCKYCYDNGEFLHKVSMDEFVIMCSQFAEQAGMTEEQMRDYCSHIFPTLKRWKK